MSTTSLFTPAFNATPVISRQLILSSDRPAAPDSYDVVDLGGVWLAAAQDLPRVELSDSAGRAVAVVLGWPYSEFDRRFLPSGAAQLPIEVTSLDDVEAKLLPRLAGTFLLVTTGDLPRRAYPDHGGSMTLVYSAQDRRAASSSSLLLDEAAYKARFNVDLHAMLVAGEGEGGWIPGPLTAHHGVRRLIPNHTLDLTNWTVSRYWPKPDTFKRWGDMSEAVEIAADALGAFSHAACDAFRVGATLTAGFDSRVVAAGFHADPDRVTFITIDTKIGKDVDLSQVIAKRYGLNHRLIPPLEADERQMAIWDRVVGDCMLEGTRRNHPTLGALTDIDALFTGLYGEVGRCRLYRQDYNEINSAKIDAKFIIDRMTNPAHPELIASVDEWLGELVGQPPSILLELAFIEMKVSCWGMGQRPMTNSIKLNLLPFAQRRVMEAFMGVAPEQKGTEALFGAVLRRLSPQLAEMPINKYGDMRDYLGIWYKLSNPARVRRYLRDRFARKSA